RRAGEGEAAPGTADWRSGADGSWSPESFRGAEVNCPTATDQPERSSGPGDVSGVSAARPTASITALKVSEGEAASPGAAAEGDPAGGSVMEARRQASSSS